MNKPRRPRLRLIVGRDRPSVFDRELHIAAAARRSYGLEDRLFSLHGEVILVNLEDIRTLAGRLNETRDLLHHPEAAIRSGDLNAMGLIDEIFHFVIQLYRDEHGSDTLRRAVESVRQEIGERAFDETLTAFVSAFPPDVVHRGGMRPREYLTLRREGLSGREVACEELLMLWLENANPAYGVCRELFADDELQTSTAYESVVASLRRFFAAMPPFGPDDEPLVEMLRRPAVEHPNSLLDQLEYIRTRWSRLIGRYFFRLLRGTDLMREERRSRHGGSGLAPVLTFEPTVGERAMFSPDQEWMPRVVLLAKNTLVWLDQLSKRYGRSIGRLDEIPEEALDTIAERGFNSLWLIGVWRRSAASRRIKQLCGNPEAEASAYSLAEYEIAGSIGGWSALETLRRRCAARGIRLASDMVPNHTGIDSRWVVEHPDWYISLPHSPFPAYRFSGEDLCDDPRVSVRLEDHYFDKSDAAVVFERIDTRTGESRYIYHGNDGTHMPWNDTAQLDFLNPEAREAVVQTILHTARSFPIIRFDAAMTLAKQHFARLWYPPPGSGGDIPSRSEHGLTKEEFDRAMPQEFWREVVDRVAKEAPHTLLLAEAFWMMEGYFVRSLGMHRVYNSAFMNMLKNEENQKYRQTIKNVIEFDRRILGRFVNFMSNPDEDTAIQQFGTGDKYFGVCTLMITMPGLPMFAHGQVEGLTEKYGMEYARAYHDEVPNRELVERHNREIFPLLSKRYLFAGVENFALFDVIRDDGSVTEEIYAYTNTSDSECVLVVYNNSLRHRWGWIRESATYADGAEDRVYLRRTLQEVLHLHRDHRRFCIFREQRSGLWYIRNSAEIADRGLFLSLAGYQCQVFTDFHEVADDEYSHYARLSDSLGGSGVADIEASLKGLLLQPVYESFARVANSGTLFAVTEALLGRSSVAPERLEAAVDGYRDFAAIFVQYADLDPIGVARAVARFERLLSSSLVLRYRGVEDGRDAAYRRGIAFFSRGVEAQPSRIELLTAFLLFVPLSSLVSGGRPTTRADRRTVLGIVENWLLEERLLRVLEILGYAATDLRDLRGTLRILLDHYTWLDDTDKKCGAALRDLLEEPEIAQFIGVNRFENTLWFSQERFEDLCWWMLCLAGLEASESEERDRTRRIERIGKAYDCVEVWLSLGRRSEYRLEDLVALLFGEQGSEGENEINQRLPRPG